MVQYLHSLSDSELAERREAAELAMRVMGITFTVYSEVGGIDRVWAFDIIPRIITAREWGRIEAGLKQRVQALNMFIADIYAEQKIIKDGIFPKEVLENSVNFHEQCIGVRPALDIWAHICGSDLVRDKDGTMYVLEDNLRVPSGVSYMLENRLVMKRVFPELFEDYSILPVDGYPSRLFDTLASLSPRPDDYPTIVVLTPGMYNSAYFEHSYLAQQMGVELVEGSDLVVVDGYVHMKTTRGLQRVDVIYRRIDDAFLDPLCFRPDSMLGIPGLMNVYRSGGVTLASAPGEIVPSREFYSYAAKYIDDDSELLIPAPFSPEQADMIQQLAIMAFQPTLVRMEEVLGKLQRCRGFVRDEPSQFLLGCIPYCSSGAETSNVDPQPKSKVVNVAVVVSVEFIHWKEHRQVR